MKLFYKIESRLMDYKTNKDMGLNSIKSLQNKNMHGYIGSN